MNILDQEGYYSAEKSDLAGDLKTFHNSLLWLLITIRVLARQPMKLLPYDKFTIRTYESLNGIHQRLLASVEPQKSFRNPWSHNHAPYEGELLLHRFQIHRIIHHRNSFLPVIKGELESFSEHETLIHITMSLHPVVLGFLGFWCFNWYGALLPMTVLGYLPWQGAILFLGLPLLMLVIFWWVFWAEVRKSRRDLTQILQGKS
ncbi:MAG: hypothetical protein ACRC8A_01740 [Microcoleaceae cyanobacterium]